MKKYPMKRIDYLFETFVHDKAIGINKFISQVNDSYYKHAADLYEEHDDNLEPLYADLFRQIPSGAQLIDIGAGTGHTLRIIDKIGYNYSHYYFVEPSQRMSSRAGTTSEKVTIINEYIENCWERFDAVSNNPRIFMISACLHHIIYLDTFLENIKNRLRPNDIFLVAHEPNSAFHSSITGMVGWLYRFSFYIFVRNFARILKRKILGKSRPKPDLGSHLRKAREELVALNIVTPKFSEEMVYAITDYQVSLNWKNIHIPKRYNEGYLTLSNLYSKLEMECVFLKTYRHLIATPRTKVGKLLKIILETLFPSSGYFFFVAFKK